LSPLPTKIAEFEMKNGLNSAKEAKAVVTVLLLFFEVIKHV